ncbi:MAG: hypothetical protein HYS55_00025 [Candidatus Omnitrophica bacterium]|nr:hypothetical protein [Candidatus Omnitrophota bacterium]
MKKSVLIGMLAFGISFVFLPHLSFAQDEPKPEAPQIGEAAAPTEEAVPQEGEEEPTEFSYGTVKSISAGEFVLTEYDYDNDKDIDVTYTVPAEATFEGVTKLEEIVIGDAVDVDYAVKDGKRIALALAVEKPLEEDEETAGAPESKE